MVLGKEPKGRSDDLTFGLLLHSVVERYNLNKYRQEMGHNENLEEVFTWAWKEARQWKTENTIKNRYTLLRTLVWYLDRMADDPLRTRVLASGRPAIELSFNFESPYHTRGGEPFILCGHIDRIATMGDRDYITDIKTTKNALDERFFAGFTPDNQFTLYALAGKTIFGIPIEGLIVDGVEVKVGFSRFRRALISRSSEQIEEWLRDLEWWLRQAEDFARAEYWPMNDKACFRCPFRAICSHNPSARDIWLDGDEHFVERVWDPIKTRGDI
jgi:hypothetical protein